MRIYQFFCDRCGTEIKHTGIGVDVYTRDIHYVDEDKGVVEIRVDLCRACKDNYELATLKAMTKWVGTCKKFKEDK